MNYDKLLADAIERVSLVAKPLVPKVGFLENGYRAWFSIGYTFYCVGVQDKVFWLTYAHPKGAGPCRGFYRFWHKFEYDYFVDENIDLEGTPRWLSVYVRESAHYHFQRLDFSVASFTYGGDACTCISVHHLNSYVINFLKENAK